MRIIFLTENFPPERNAAASRVYERACYWVKWGHEVTVITQAPNFPEGRIYAGYRNRWYQTEEMDGIHVVRVKTYICPNERFIRRILDFISFMGAAFVAGLFQERPDVVVATSPQFFTAVGGWALAAVRRLPFVFELGDIWPAAISALGVMRTGTLLQMLERVELFLYRRSAAVMALTHAFKDDLVRRGISAGKIFVVINGVDLSRFAPREEDGELAALWQLSGKFVVGYVGNHGMAQALENVLDAADRLRSSPDIRFIFVGTGVEKTKLVSESERWQLPNVMFIPPQPKESIARVWSLCDVALVSLKNLPIYSTVIPSKIFEAMGMGLPILFVGPIGEASEIIEGEKAGICVSASESDKLANAVLRLRHEIDVRRRLAENSANAAQRYSREKQARDGLAVLDFALDQ